jgi:amino acid transporter
MSEETKNPAKTVPRVLYASTIAHFIMTYLLTAMFIFGIAPYAKGRFSISPVIPVYLILGVSRRTLYAFVCLAMFASTTQLIASVVVTSRFIFALARDYAMPFSDGLYRTNSRKEPWVADLLVIFSLYASVAGWYLPRGNYYNLIQTFWYWFMAIPYVSIHLFTWLIPDSPRSFRSACTSSPTSSCSS